jgi:Flp pilus assembly protein CpaB
MVLAAVLAFGTNLMVLRGQDETRAVVVAASDLVAGRALDRNDFRAVEVDVDDDLFSRLLPWQQVDGLAGMVTARPITAGDLIGRNDLREAAAVSGLRAISIPIAADHAVGGDLVPGDRIDLILVRDDVPEYVLVDAEVLSVSNNERAALSIGGFFVIVGVDEERALAVAAAIQDGHIEVIRSTGATVDGGVSP